MKFPRLFSLLLAACSVLAVAPGAQPGFAPAAKLGNIMYVGDSITHGVDSASYRWPLFKIWVDNGVEHREVGVNSGNWRGGVAQNTPYSGQIFRNRHSAISSERAYEIAGRINQSGRLENSNIHDWLGLNTSYTGKRRIDPASDMPDTFIMLIGTNDTLSDSGRDGIHSRIEPISENLLGKRRGKLSKKSATDVGDMGAIITAMRRANPQARIAICTIPTWVDGRPNNNAREDFAAIEAYNKQLKQWGRQQRVAVVEVNHGLVDVRRAKEIPFVGVPNMFVADRLHPSPQGDLIIAGNIARQLGYAGRTAGLPRKAAGELPQQEMVTSIKPGTPVCLEGRAEAGLGATAVLDLGEKGFGDGARRGWYDNHYLPLSLTAAGQMGTLTLAEHGILWGKTMLYAMDTSRLVEPLRLCYVPADPERNIPGGFYVWMGDMLIGEALQGSPAAGEPGLSLVLRHRRSAPIKLSYDPKNAWAPEAPRRGKK